MSVKIYGHKINKRYLKDFKEYIKNTKVNLISNPILWRRYGYYEIALEGDGREVSRVSLLIYDKGWNWEEKKRKKILGIL